jgi:hypothetical protein
MLDENEVCEEVVALLDRMDKFPEEFLDDFNLHTRWGTIMGQIRNDPSNTVFTPAEHRLLKEKVQGLARVRMKKEILQNIMHVEASTYDDIVYNATKGRSAIAVPIQNGGSANAVWSNPYPDQIKKMEEDNRIEMEKHIMKIAKQMAKPKNTPEKY